MTPIFFGVGTAISHEPDEPESVPVVPVVPAPALESAPLTPSVIFWIGYKKEKLVQVQFEERNNHSYNYLIWKHDFQSILICLQFIIIANIPLIVLVPARVVPP